MKRGVIVRLAFALLWLFVFSMPSEKSIEIDGVGTITRLAGMVAFGAGAAAVISEARLRLPAAGHVVLALLVFWSAITVRWSLSPEWTNERVMTYIQLFALVWLVWELCLETPQVQSLLGAYALGTFVPVADTLRRYLSGEETFYQRYATTGFDPNDLAITLALSLPMAFHLSLRGGGMAWIYRAQMAAVSATILLTASRTGMVALLAASGFAALSLRGQPRYRKAGVAVAALAMTGLAAAYVPASSWERLATTITEVRSGTLNSRTVLWSGGWQAFRNAPFQGIGAGAYPETLALVVGHPAGFVPVAHNTFLSVLVETGLVGFTLFATLLGILVWNVRKKETPLKRMLGACLLVWAIGVSTLTWEHRKPTWLLFALVLARPAARVAAVQRASESSRRVMNWRVA